MSDDFLFPLDNILTYNDLLETIWNDRLDNKHINDNRIKYENIIFDSLENADESRTFQLEPQLL